MNAEINSSITLEDFLAGKRFVNERVYLKGSGALPHAIISAFLNECGPICLLTMEKHIFSKLLGFEMTVVGPGDRFQLGGVELDAPYNDGSLVIFRAPRFQSIFQRLITIQIMPLEHQMMFGSNNFAAAFRSQCNNVCCKCDWNQ